MVRRNDDDLLVDDVDGKCLGAGAEIGCSGRMLVLMLVLLLTQPRAPLLPSETTLFSTVITFHIASPLPADKHDVSKCHIVDLTKSSTTLTFC